MRIQVISILATALLITGCQGNPTTPPTPTSPQNPDIAQASNFTLDNSHQCLGYYSFLVETKTSDITIDPDRSANFHLNMTGVLNGTMGVTAKGVPSESDPPNGLFVFDVTLKHPYASKPQFAGFDVKGILITPGTMIGIGPLVFADTDETRLENADGFTRWWNPTEFTAPGLFGYIKGKLANSNAPVLTATVNPYKCFADILTVDNGLDKVTSKPLDDDLGRAVFRAGSNNSRRYQIRFPLNPAPVIKFGYAVDACWKAPVPNPPTNVPDNFPIEANQPEAFGLYVGQAVNSLYYDTETGHGGGSLWVYASVQDWQGELAGDVAAQTQALKLWSPALGLNGVDMDFTGESSWDANYYKKLWTEMTPTQPGDFTLAWQAVSKNGPSYKQGGQPAPNDPVSAWQVQTVTVTDPECGADANVDAATAEMTGSHVGKSGDLCFTDDPSDWFKFTITHDYEGSGTIRFIHDAGVQDMKMYDISMDVIGTTNNQNGYSEIKWDSTHLYAGTYYIEVKLVSDVGAIMYMLDTDIDMVKVTPTPAQIQTPFLDCDAQWIKILDSTFSILAGYAGTWVMSTNEITPYQIGRTYDYINTEPAYSNSHMYYWEDAADNPAGIDMIDFTTPSMPVQHEDVLVIPYNIEAVTMNSQFLYVAYDDGADSYIQIYNWATDPIQPQLVKTFKAYYKDIIKLALIDPEGSSTTLVALTFHATTLYDVEDSETAGLIDFHSNPDLYNNDVSVGRTLAGGQATVAVSSFDLDGLGYLEVIKYDTSTHDFPSFGNIDMPEGAGYVMVKGSIVYVSDGTGFSVIDIAVNNDFHNTGHTDSITAGGRMDYDGNVLQAINYGAGFSVYNNADPYNPVETKRPSFLNYPRAAVTSMDGKYGFFAEVMGFNFEGALKVVSIDWSPSSKVQREYLLNGNTTTIDLDGSHLVVGASSPVGHIWVYDVSDPLDCQLVYEKNFSNGVTAVKIIGIALYVTTNDGKLNVFSLSAWPTVTQKPSLNFPGNDKAGGIVQHNHRLYISRQGGDNIWVYDISDMLSPSWITTCTYGVNINDMAFGSYLWKDYLYLGTSGDFKVLNITNQNTPQQIASISMSGGVRYLAVDGQYAYLSGQKNNPAVATIFPPANPLLTGVVFPEHPIFYNAGNFVENGILYEMEGTIGFRAFDLYP
jgi:hypothetical protein